MTNALAYLLASVRRVSDVKKKFYSIGGMKVLVPGKTVQLSLIFLNKSRAYPS
jgi:hypothetical protein